VLHSTEVVEKLKTMSFTPVGSSPAEMAKFLLEESTRWRAVIAAAGIRAE
jgi:tripartite-type tricarboxylate transporter receptor subunit TctC